MAPPTTRSGPAAEEFDRTEEAVARHLYEIAPGYAVALGRHEYDGRLPVIAPSATERWAEEADKLLAQLRGIDARALPAERTRDRFLLELLLESVLFDLRESRDLDRNPMSLFGSLSLTSYLVREYAPAPERVQAVVRTLEAIPKFLEDGTRRLEPKLPKPFVSLAIAMGSGLPEHFGEAETFAKKRDSVHAAAVSRARSGAEAAVKSLLERLKTEFLPRTNDDYALGTSRYEKLLWVREGLRTSPTALLAQGQADLKRNQTRLNEIAASKGKGTTVEQLLKPLYEDHPTAADLIPSTQKLVDQVKAFVAEKRLATIPEPSVCRVEETPAFGRALFTASMNPPGPYDTQGDEGIYFVTPVDPAWAPEKQEEWLRSLNRSMLGNITVHEVYPGHYLQLLHHRKHARTTSQRVYTSPSFVEGWAHYTEQLAVEAGFGTDPVAAEVAQLHDALLRDCRLIASVGLHTQGWSVEQATKLFQKEAHFEELPAQREAIRGTFNPEYFCYTLGKLAILDVREKYLKAKFGGDLTKFHDTLLSFGSPPVGTLDELVGAAP